MFFLKDATEKPPAATDSHGLGQYEKNNRLIKDIEFVDLEEVGDRNLLAHLVVHFSLTLRIVALFSFPRAFHVLYLGVCGVCLFMVTPGGLYVEVCG